MARRISYMNAINEAMAQEMERDSTVVVFGEDNVGGTGSPGEMDAWGGVMGVTKGSTGSSRTRSSTPRSASRPLSGRRRGQRLPA
nr:hypothetical protein [Rubrobacter marinus]